MDTVQYETKALAETRVTADEVRGCAAVPATRASRSWRRKKTEIKPDGTFLSTGLQKGEDME